MGGNRIQKKAQDHCRIRVDLWTPKSNRRTEISRRRQQRGLQTNFRDLPISTNRVISQSRNVEENEDGWQNLESDSWEDYANDLNPDGIQPCAGSQTVEPGTFSYSEMFRTDTVWNKAYSWYRVEPGLVKAMQGESACSCNVETKNKQWRVTVIGLFECKKLSLKTCQCVNAVAELLFMGYFPSSPVRPRFAFSLQLLRLFRNIWVQGPISRIAWCKGLLRTLQEDFEEATQIKSFYKGFLDCLHMWLRVKNKVQQGLDSLISSHGALLDTAAEQVSIGMRDVCPACFGGDSDGASRMAVVSLDGNLSQRRLAATKARSYWRTKYDVFLPTPSPEAITQDSTERCQRQILGTEDFPDTCGERFQAARNVAPSRGCDDTGLFAAVCRHDIPLKLVNMKRSGEKFIFPMTIARWLTAEHPQLKWLFLYDIGCTFEKHARRALPNIRQEDLNFGVSVFHAFAHHFGCQVRYSPRRIPGAGWSDGEGTERLWSAIRHVIPALRYVSEDNRLQILSELVCDYRQRLLEDLGPTLLRRWKAVHKRMTEVRSEKEGLAFKESYISGQREAQLRFSTKQAIGREKDPRNAIYMAAKRFHELKEYHLNDIAKDGDLDHILHNHILADVRRVALHLDALLRDGGFTQGDWTPESPLYREFDQRSIMSHVRDAKKTLWSLLCKKEFELDRVRAGRVGMKVGTKAAKKALEGIKRRNGAIKKAVAHYNSLFDKVKKVPDLLNEVNLIPLSVADVTAGNPGLDDCFWEIDTFQSDAWANDPRIRRSIELTYWEERLEEEKLMLIAEANRFLKWLEEKVRRLKSIVSELEPENMRCFGTLLNTEYRRWNRIYESTRNLLSFIGAAGEDGIGGSYIQENQPEDGDDDEVLESDNESMASVLDSLHLTVDD